VVKRIYSFILTFLTFTSFAIPAYADSACAGGNTGFNFSLLCSFGGNNLSTGTLVGRVISLLLLVAVLIALVFLVIGGIRWITSGGDKTKLESARGHLVAAIVGLIVALLAYLIINVVLHLFGLNAGGVSNFNVPTLR